MMMMMTRPKRPHRHRGMKKPRRMSRALVVVAALGATACAQALGVDGDTPPVDLCQTYCSRINEACATTDNPQPEGLPDEPGLEQFESERACLAACRQLPHGTDPQSTANDAQCRFRNAQAAFDLESDTERTVQCPAAGPGTTVCGPSPCENFCTQFERICGPSGVFQQVHGDVAGCLENCSRFPQVNGGVFSSRITLGDSLECRWYHLTAAAVDAAIHCPHVAGFALCRDEDAPDGTAAGGGDPTGDGGNR